MTDKPNLTPETLKAAFVGVSTRRYLDAYDNLVLARHEEAWKADRERLEALEKIINLQPMPDYGDLYTIDEFLDHVKSGGITDNDGSAYAALADGRTSIEVSPRGVLYGQLIGTGFTHIAWFNK